MPVHRIELVLNGARPRARVHGRDCNAAPVLSFLEHDRFSLAEIIRAISGLKDRRRLRHLVIPLGSELEPMPFALQMTDLAELAQPMMNESKLLSIAYEGLCGQTSCLTADQRGCMRAARLTTLATALWRRLFWLLRPGNDDAVLGATAAAALLSSEPSRGCGSMPEPLCHARLAQQRFRVAGTWGQPEEDRQLISQIPQFKAVTRIQPAMRVQHQKC